MRTGLKSGIVIYTDVVNVGIDASPIRGPEGNIEFLAWLVNARREEPDLDINAVVDAAHGGKP